MSHSELWETSLALQWYVPGRVLYMVIRGSLSEEAARHGDQLLMQHLNSASETVHLLMDVTRAHKATSSLFHLHQHILRHIYMGWVVTVGVLQIPIINFGISALSLKTKIRHRDWPSMHEALTFLAHTDPSLPDLKTYHHVLV